MRFQMVEVSKVTSNGGNGVWLPLPKTERRRRERQRLRPHDWQRPVDDTIPF